MKNIRKTLRIIILAVSVTVLACGCRLLGAKSQTAESLLEEKYGEQFVVGANNEQALLDGYYTVHAYAKSHPELPFTVHVDNDGKQFSDNYIERRVAQKITEHIYENAKSFLTEPCVYTVVPAAVLGGKDPDISIEDYLAQNPANPVTVHVTVKEGEEPAERIYRCLSDSVQELRCLHGLIVLNIADKETLEKIRLCSYKTDSLGEDYHLLQGSCRSFNIRYSSGSLSFNKAQFLDYLNDGEEE